MTIMPLSCHGFAMNFYLRLVMRTAIPLAFMVICVLAKTVCVCGSKSRAAADRAMSAAFFLLFLLCAQIGLDLTPSGLSHTCNC